MATPESATLLWTDHPTVPVEAVRWALALCVAALMLYAVSRPKR